MLRSTLLYLSNQPRIFRFVRNNKLAKKFAHRFVAGETLDEALAAVRVLNSKGITASLDLLGESVNNAKPARPPTSISVSIAFMRRLRGNVSVARSHGLDISEERVREITTCSAMQAYNTFVRLDISRAPTPSARYVCSRTACIRQRKTSASCSELSLSNVVGRRTGVADQVSRATARSVQAGVRRVPGRKKSTPIM
jgi:hypothetical protein